MLDGLLIAELLLLGSVGGFLAGLLGVGGGMMMVPFMTLLLSSKGFPAELIVKVAVATSLATNCFTSISSVRAHHSRGAVRWLIVRQLAPGMVVGALLGAQLAKVLPGALLAGFFALFVGVSATRMLIDPTPKAAQQLPGTAGLFGVGGLIGGVAALVGAGGAFLSVPFMTRCQVRMHEAVGTSAALGFPIALAGSVGYMIAGRDLQNLPPGMLGFLYLPALAVISVASVLTAPLGARCAHALDRRQLQRVFALLLYGLAGYMLYKAIRP